MKAVLLFGLFMNTLLMYNADNTKRVRHSDLHTNIHGRQSRGRGRQTRQWPANYRSYPSQYYPGVNVYRQEALMADIRNLLSELQVNLSTKKQTPQYQPVYIPYPVQLSIPYNVPVSTNKMKKPNKSIPAFPNRNSFGDDDEKEYTRPILLKPVTETSSSTTRTTEKINDTEGAIVFKDSNDESQNDIGEPSTCEAAILSCCRFTQPKERQTCFTAYKCSKTYATKIACDKKVIQVVVQRFVDTYTPK